MRVYLVSSLIATATLLGAPSVWAGHLQERHGFWVGFGAGYGSASASIDCGDCPSGDREGSVSGFLKLGGTLDAHVLLGVETNVWVKNEPDDTTLSLAAFTGTVTVYPQATGGLFLKAGVGGSYVRSEVRAESLVATLSKTGWAVLVGAGYDVRVGRSVSLTPCINYHYGKPGDIDFEGVTIFPGWKQDVVSFELGITFH